MLTIPWNFTPSVLKNYVLAHKDNLARMRLSITRDALTIDDHLTNLTEQCVPCSRGLLSSVTSLCPARRHPDPAVTSSPLSTCRAATTTSSSSSASGTSWLRWRPPQRRSVPEPPRVPSNLWRYLRVFFLLPSV